MADQRTQRRIDRSLEAEKQFEERVVHIDRVARVVKGGRRFRFRALVVVGDKKGRVAVASSKGADVTAAVTKAVSVAKKNLATINLYNGTLPHEATAKVGGAQILIKPASPGTGLIAGGTVRTILEVAGVSNALSKSLGSANKTNTAYATMQALLSMTPAEQWITRQQKPAKTVTSKSKATKKVETKAKPAKKAAKK